MNTKLTFAIFLLFASTFLSAQTALNLTDSKGRKQGYWVKYNAQKKKLYEGTFVDNIPTGKFIYYYDTGIQRSIAIFSNNGKVTRTKMFDSGGNLSGEGKYVDEQKDSTWVFYNQEGKKISDEIYLKGIKNGIARVYFANGELAEEKFYKNGMLEGVAKKFFESGQIKSQMNYVNNKVDGIGTFYYPSGKIDAQGKYVNDLKEGDWKYFDENGKLKQTLKYRNGRRMNDDSDVITKEKENAAKLKYQQFEIKDPFEEGYTPK
jgi:antitoxin component YwqK of YwqJK toxin-antitoxin module